MLTELQRKTPHWFCVSTKPSHELQSILSLKRISDEIRKNVGEIEIYFPQIKKQMPVGGVLRKVLRPLFPRYFFAHFIWEAAFRFVVSRPQIIEIVTFGEFPAVVSSKMIEELKAWSLDEDKEIFDPTLQWSHGQRVMIHNGPFKGMEAEFVMHLSDQKRVVLLLDHLQSHAQLVVDRLFLKAV